MNCKYCSVNELNVSLALTLYIQTEQIIYIALYIFNQTAAMYKLTVKDMCMANRTCQTPYIITKM